MFRICKYTVVNTLEQTGGRDPNDNYSVIVKVASIWATKGRVASALKHQTMVAVMDPRTTSMGRPGRARVVHVPVHRPGSPGRHRFAGGRRGEPPG